ncbi:MAG: hypothetical protein M3273_02330 [Actinomycetota bacterium]|nr:hypothetical protein [Actinomycetota bacterium]
MPKLKLLVVVAVVAIPAVGAMASPAQACVGGACTYVNRVCSKVFGGECLP